MMIKNINKYQVEIDGRIALIEFSGTKKELEKYIREDKALGDGSFRPMRMLSRIRKDNHYFNYLKLEY
jgi:hypothetical protein